MWEMKGRCEMTIKTYIGMTYDGFDVLWDSFSCVRLDSRLNVVNLKSEAFKIYKSYLKWKPNSVNGFRIFRCSSLLEDSNYTIYEYREKEK